MVDEFVGEPDCGVGGVAADVLAVWLDPAGFDVPGNLTVVVGQRAPVGRDPLGQGRGVACVAYGVEFPQVDGDQVRVQL